MQAMAHHTHGPGPNFRWIHPPQIHLAAISPWRSRGSGGSGHRHAVDPILAAA